MKLGPIRIKRSIMDCGKFSPFCLECWRWFFTGLYYENILDYWRRWKYR